jgi:hypothetical protein
VTLFGAISERNGVPGLLYSFLLLLKWDNPQKEIPAPLAEKKKNNARPRGDPHDKIPYKTSIK